MTAPTLFELAADRFPNVEPFWSLGDSLLLDFGPARYIVTTDTDGAGEPVYLVGIYNLATAATDDQPEFYAEFPADEAAAVVDYLDTITEPPEEVDYFAWADQWTRDAIADGRIAAEHLTSD